MTSSFLLSVTGTSRSSSSIRSVIGFVVPDGFLRAERVSDILDGIDRLMSFFEKQRMFCFAGREVSEPAFRSDNRDARPLFVHDGGRFAPEPSQGSTTPTAHPSFRVSLDPPGGRSVGGALL
jgi:hypothetical protein